MSSVEAINSFFVSVAPSVAASSSTSAAQDLTSDQVAQGFVASLKFELPDLASIGDTATSSVQFFDVAGNFNDLTATFRRTSTREVRVDVQGTGAATGGGAAFFIRTNPSGTIQGYDLENANRITTSDSPAVDFTGRGKLVQLQFDDSRVGDFGFGFSSVTFRGEYLQLLQGVGGTNPLAESGVAPSSISGTSGADVLSGTVTSDTLYGGSGNDTITGLTGNDIIYGEGGNDTLIGNAGGDYLFGGSGTDTVDYSSGVAGVTVDLSSSTATDSYGHTDQLSSIENVTGSDYADSITGDTNSNSIDGGTGADTLNDGSGGTNTLTGGSGNDTFAINDGVTTTTITDFSTGADTIDLSGVSALTDFSSVQSAATDDSTDTTIDLGSGGSLVLQNVTVADLSSGDFTF